VKLHILSDLHVEFGDFNIPDVGADIVILAGDIHVKDKGLKWIIRQLWSDMELSGDRSTAMSEAAEGMNDYHLIWNNETNRKLTPKETVAWHKQSAKKLREFLETGDPSKSVVVTHSVPSIQSIPERFRDHALVPAFASNMENLIQKFSPRLWIHGHTHDSFDYHIGKTRILCNPRGYVPDAYNADFDEKMIVRL